MVTNEFHLPDLSLDLLSLSLITKLQLQVSDAFWQTAGARIISDRPCPYDGGPAYCISVIHAAPKSLMLTDDVYDQIT